MPNMGLKITSSITGPLTLAPSDNPLTVTSTGSITSTGAGNDGVDGAAGAAWYIINGGTISSDGGWGVNLADTGVLDNFGTIVSLLGGFETFGIGLVTNDGAISGTGRQADGILLNAGGSVTNTEHGSISGETVSGVGVDIESAFGVITNQGTISGATGVNLDAGGSVTNSEDGSILGNGPGYHGVASVSIDGGVGVVTNEGEMTGNGYGVLLLAGGSVTNSEGGSITGSEFGGIDIEGAYGTVGNSGTIKSDSGAAVFLDAGGSVTNAASGSIIAAGRMVGVEISNGVGVVTNDGEINGGYGNGVVLDTGGSVKNSKGASIDAGLYGVGVELDGSGTVTNNGAINGAQSGGVYLAAGGAVTNTQSGSISAGLRATGVDIGGGAGLVSNEGSITGSGAGVGLEVAGSVTNNGTISGTGNNLGIRSDGVFINAGNVTNEAGGSIKGVSNAGVETGTGSVTITNAGTISGGTDSVLFGAGSNDNLLVITPSAVFKGAADATAATNSTIELTSGTGAIKGIGNGDFLGFNTLVADKGANWTLKGANTIGTVLDDGKLEMSGGLTVSTAVDPASTGAFLLDHGSTLEVAAALGANSTMSFDPGSELVIDDFALFGQHVGSSNYAGSPLKDFGGSTVDLKDFGIAGLQDAFSTSSGLLQLTNSAAQVATLDFQNSSLGAGTFHFASDGSGGVLVKHS